jgi:O-6-methylguanine DNA methyltransferase
MNPLLALPIATDEGTFLARYSERGLAELDFPRGKSLPAADADNVPAQILRWHRATTAALQQALAGRPAKNLPPLDWSGRPDFQQAVWREMLKLGPGETKSYGEVARAIGNPRASRAVGGACGANPIPVLVPCHRILAAHQQLGGFSGGLDWKRRLLDREGVVTFGTRRSSPRCSS